MARISLLFSLALVLASGSVSAHPPGHQKHHKTVCLSELQSFTFNTINKVVQKKALETVDETTPFKILFSICKGYTEYLGLFQNFKGTKNVAGMVHAKYAVMTRAMLTAQSVVGVEGSLSIDLSKSYSDMAQGFVELAAKIAEISTSYKFKANAIISQDDKIALDRCVFHLKFAIMEYFKVIAEISKKCALKGDFEFRYRIGSGFLGAFVTHGLEFGANAGANVGAELGAQAGGKVDVKVGALAGANAEIRIGGKAGGKAKGGARVGAKAGVGAKVGAGGKAGGILGGFLGLGGNVQFDAAGKANVGGEKEFRTLSHPNNKHLV